VVAPSPKISPRGWGRQGLMRAGAADAVRGSTPRQSIELALHLRRHSGAIGLVALNRPSLLPGISSSSPATGQRCASYW